MKQILKLSAQIYHIDSYRYFCETEKGNLIYSKLDNSLKSIEMSLEDWVKLTGERLSIGCIITLDQLAPRPIYFVTSTFLSRIC